MADDIAIQVWHHGGHWSIKKSGLHYWHRETNGTEWKSGLPPGMTKQTAAKAFRKY